MQERGGPRPFDVATRGLIEADPAGWLLWLGLPVNGPVRPIDTEVSTVLAQVDKVLRVEARPPWLAHLELQVSRDRLLPSRLHQYHAILLHKHQIHVKSTLILLRKRADDPLSGRFEPIGPDGEIEVSFRYRVVRLWERPVDALLAGSVGVLPLAPLAALRRGQLRRVLDHLGQRFEQEAPAEADDLWAATALLMGVRYDRDAITGLIQRVRRMRESVTYQIILEEGREEGEIREARRTVLDLGGEKFGPPTESIVSAIQALEDLELLHRMVRATLRANNWQELLAAGQG